MRRVGTEQSLQKTRQKDRRWLNELMTDPQSSTETIAGREGCSVRMINKTISLAFLAPDLVREGSY